MIIRLKGVKKVRAKGHEYYYHRKTGKRFTAAYGSAEFVREWQTFEALLNPGADAARPGTLSALIAAYRASPEFKGLKERTRADYQRIFDYLAKIGAMPLLQLDTGTVLGIRDKAFAKHKRRFANYTLQVLRLVLSWGMQRGWLERNPAAGCPTIRRPKDAPIVNRPWKVAEFEAALGDAEPGLKAAIALGGYSGLREGDVIRFCWSAYNGKDIEGRQAKTGDPIWIPAHRSLREILGSTAKKGPVIVTGKKGRPFQTESGFRAVFFRYLRKLEKEEKIGSGLTFHGLRHMAGVMLADAGCDTRDIMAVLGHRSEAMARTYTEGADQKKRATAAIRKLERKSGKPKTPA